MSPFYWWFWDSERINMSLNILQTAQGRNKSSNSAWIKHNPCAPPQIPSALAISWTYWATSLPEWVFQPSPESAMSSCWPVQHGQDSADTRCLVPFLTSRSLWKLHYRPWVWYLESSCQGGQMPVWGTIYLWGICSDLWETGDGEDLGKCSPSLLLTHGLCHVCACLLGEVPSSQQVHPPEALLHLFTAYYEVVAS